MQKKMREVMGPLVVGFAGWWCGTWTAAAGDIEWRDDLERSMAEARENGKPVFVTWRCLPCKQCASFDQEVLEGGPELTPLLERFVTVRMTNAAQLDFRRFPAEGFQDLDVSWWGYVLSPEGRIYGIFGGKDHISDATRISVPALANTLRRILAYHENQRGNPDHPEGAGRTPPFPGAAASPRELPGYAAFEASHPWLKQQDCIHCHQVNDVLRYPSVAAGTFDVVRDLQPWPLPENTGILLDRDHGLLIRKVEPGSPAEAAGIRGGDELARADGWPLFGQADFRGVLHRAEGTDAFIAVQWLRGGERHEGTLELREGWKATPIAWRKSVYDGIIGPGPGFFPLRGPRSGKGSLSIRPFMGKKPRDNPGYERGLRPQDEIVAVNGQREDWDSRELLTWIRLNLEAGDDLVLEVRDKSGATRTVRGPIPVPKTR